MRNVKGRGKGCDILGEFKSNLPKGDNSSRDKICMDKFLGWGWILPEVGAGYKAACQNPQGLPVCPPQRAKLGFGSADTRGAGIRQHGDFLSQREKLTGDLRHVKRITVAAAGTAPGASEVALPALNKAISSGPSQPGAAVFSSGSWKHF